MNRYTRSRTKVATAAVVSAAALLGVGCSSASEANSTKKTTTTAVGATTSSMNHSSGSSSGMDATKTPAAELRAGLTDLLVEHVYLAGIAISTAVHDGLEAPSTTAAVAALDTNSVDLSKAIGSVYGDDAAASFLTLWRDHIGMFVDYTKAKASGDTAGADKAKAELDQYRTKFADFVAKATDDKLPADATAENLQMHVNTLLTAIDLTIEGKPEAFAALREAAQHMPSTAEALAGAISQQMPDKFGN